MNEMKAIGMRLIMGLAIILLAGGCAKDIVESLGTVFGKITDAKSGETLNNVYVSLNPSGKSTVTGSDGTFELKELDPGQYDLQIQKSGYQTNTKKITVVAGQIISRDATLAPEVVESRIRLSTSSLNFGSTATTLNFSIENVGNSGPVTWTISKQNDAGWVSSISPSSGTTDVNKSTAVVITVNRAAITAELSTTIIVNADGESIPLQILALPTGITPSISLDIESKSLLANAAEFTVVVTSNTPWSTADVPNWIVLTPASGTGNGSVRVNVSKNSETTSRSAAIAFRVGAGVGKILNISQSGGDAQIQIGITHKNVEAAAGSFYVDVTTNGTNWSTTGVPNWMTLTPESAAGNKQVQVNYRENDTGEDRTATVQFISGNQRCSLTVVQAKKAPEDLNNVVPNGLYVYYPFENNAKNVMFDGANGILSQGTYTTGVKTGTQALALTSVPESSFSVPYGLVDGRNSSVSFWMKDVSDGHIFHVDTKSFNSGYKIAFYLEMRNGKLTYIVKRYNAAYQYDAAQSFTHASFADGKWHHVVITTGFGSDQYANIALNLYVDGEYVSALSLDYNPYDSDNFDLATGFKMGGAVTLGNNRKISGARMKVDNLRVYNTRIISSTEVKTIYNAEK